jgi:hypothetical protein
MEMQSILERDIDPAMAIVWASILPIPLKELVATYHVVWPFLLKKREHSYRMFKQMLDPKSEEGHWILVALDLNVIRKGTQWDSETHRPFTPHAILIKGNNVIDEPSDYPFVGNFRLLNTHPRPDLQGSILFFQFDGR